MKKSILLFFLILFSLSLVSCGLDVYYVLEPVQDVSYADSSRESLNRYFSFYTVESANASSGIFIGTSVYYKIYDNLTSLTSEATTISNANTEYTENGYTKMTSLGYKKLSISTNDDPLIADEQLDRLVKIRLYTEGEASGSPYEACVTVSNSAILDGSDYAIPLRSDASSTFDFFPDSAKITSVNGKTYYNNTPSSSTDEDVKMTSSSASDVTAWYVNAYVVSVGRTETFTLKYSQLTALGYIVISSSNQ